MLEPRESALCTSFKAREMTEWQQKLGTVSERNMYMLRNHMWTDCGFIIGEEAKLFQCHKLEFAKTSSTLASQLHASSDDTELKLYFPAIKPQTFDLIVKYIYGGSLGPLTKQQARHLLAALRFFDLPTSFHEQCTVFLQTAETNSSSPNSSALNDSWQKNMKTISDRDCYILKNELWTDCCFKVGKGEAVFIKRQSKKYKAESVKIFKCHRLVLAKTSPVFAAMLCREWSNPSEIIHIPDTTVNSFTFFLKYAYGGKLDVDVDKFIRSEEIWNFFLLAKKYLLPDQLINTLKGFLYSRLHCKDSINFMQGLEDIDSKLHQYFSNVLLHFTGMWFKENSYAGISPELMLFIVQQRKQLYSESDLLRHVMFWAKTMLENQQVEITRQSVMKLLDPLLPFIRFRSIKTKEFVRNVSKTGLFSKQELLKMLTYMISLHNKKQSFCKKKRKKSKFSHIYLQGCEIEDLNLDFSTFNIYNSLIHYPYYSTEKPFPQPCYISGISIPSQRKSRKCAQECYEEDLTVLVYKMINSCKDVPDPVFPNAFCTLLLKTRYTATVKFGTELYVPLRRQINICNENVGNVYYVSIFPHKSGWYPYNISKSQFLDFSNFKENRFILKVHFSGQQCDVCWEKYEEVHQVVPRTFCC